MTDVHAAPKATHVHAAPKATRACRAKSDTYPLRDYDFHGTVFKVHARYETVLKQSYGPDWRVPRPRGIKKIFCSKYRPLVWVPVALVVGYLAYWWYGSYVTGTGKSAKN